jgi:hypothetical protein
MKIGLINGSPKPLGSTSEVLLEELKALLPGEHELLSLGLHHAMLTNQQLADLTSCDALVFAFPMYMGGIPSHLLHCLMQLEKALASEPHDITVSALVNNGHYEGLQNASTIEMLKNWTARARLHWGQGLGIGTGIMIAQAKDVPLGHGQKKNLAQPLSTFVNNLLDRTSGENLYVNPTYPRFAILQGANHDWTKQGKAHGLKKKDLVIAP